MDRDTCEHFTPAGLPCEACASAAQVTRPPTPVGWSDTDWIRHLQEQKEPHPLEGLHINQGSMDAAADTYEAEYNAARGIT